MVLFDFVNEHTAEFFPKNIRKNKFIRLYFDHAGAVQKALETLYENGHRSIAVFRNTTSINSQWIYERIDLIKKIAHQLDTAIHIVEIEEPDTQNTFDASKTLYELGNIPNRDSQAMHLLLTSGATALCALNDQLARLYFFWFKNASLSIPQKISIISFDNRPDSQLLPITTIDFGFTQLGYLAAHTIINDIAINSDSTGSIKGICRVLDRGSVGVIRSDI